MRAPVLFWQKQQRKSSLEKAALCREGNGAELLPCSLAAIDQRLSCCATPTAAPILPLPCPEINTKVRKWSQRGNLLFTIYFSSTILILFSASHYLDTILQAHIQSIQHFSDINMNHYIQLLASLRGYHRCSQFHQQRCTVE